MNFKKTMWPIISTGIGIALIAALGLNLVIMAIKGFTEIDILFGFISIVMLGLYALLILSGLAEFVRKLRHLKSQFLEMPKRKAVCTLLILLCAYFLLASISFIYASAAGVVYVISGWVVTVYSVILLSKKT